jgi:hypothetical protein
MRQNSSHIHIWKTLCAVLTKLAGCPGNLSGISGQTDQNTSAGAPILDLKLGLQLLHQNAHDLHAQALAVIFTDGKSVRETFSIIGDFKADFVGGGARTDGDSA